MKVLVTRKSILAACVNIKCAGLGDLYYLLQNHEPFAYTAGIYDWNFDVYNVYGVTICTGYRNMPGERLVGVKEYEQMARAANGNHVKVESILKKFCELNGGIC